MKIDIVEEYGLTKKEYRWLLESDSVTAFDISMQIKSPEKLYRFRKFGNNTNGQWSETKFWKEDIAGICKFSTPNNFNKNDNCDCSVYFDKEIIEKYILSKTGEPRKKRRNVKSKELSYALEEYKNSLQEKVRILCFTSAGFDNRDMWEDENFGDEGRGICIEYDRSIDNSPFKPNNFSMLPILYDDKRYDSTNVVKTIIDYSIDNNDEYLKSKMVCLGHGHTLVKLNKYSPEHEWRIVIPVHDDGTYSEYFDVDKKEKKDFSPFVSAIYLGYNFSSMDNANEYLRAIKNKWISGGVPIYQVYENDGYLKAKLIGL